MFSSSLYFLIYIYSICDPQYYPPDWLEKHIFQFLYISSLQKLIYIFRFLETKKVLSVCERKVNGYGSEREQGFRIEERMDGKLFVLYINSTSSAFGLSWYSCVLIVDFIIYEHAINQHKPQLVPLVFDTSHYTHLSIWTIHGSSIKFKCYRRWR